MVTSPRVCPRGAFQFWSRGLCALVVTGFGLRVSWGLKASGSHPWSPGVRPEARVSPAARPGRVGCWEGEAWRPAPWCSQVGAGGLGRPTGEMQHGGRGGWSWCGQRQQSWGPPRPVPERTGQGPPRSPPPWCGAWTVGLARGPPGATFLARRCVSARSHPVPCWQACKLSPGCQKGGCPRLPRGSHGPAQGRRVCSGQD